MHELVSDYIDLSTGHWDWLKLRNSFEEKDALKIVTLTVIFMRSLRKCEKIWDAQIPPKIKIFLWKMVHGIFPVMEALEQRRIAASNKCQRCMETRESVLHAVRDCCWAKQVWDQLDVHGEDAANQADLMVWIKAVCTGLGSEEFNLFAVVIWSAKELKGVRCNNTNQVWHPPPPNFSLQLTTEGALVVLLETEN
ncbi:hypothetical protein REPUB_Repub11eG0049500 [Reevesia pubescens]